MTGQDTLAEVYSKALTRLEKMPNWRDVTEWAAVKLGYELWSVQKTIAEMVQQNPRTAVWSCHDSGKCVDQDDTVMLADGQWVRAGDLVGTTFTMLAYGPDGKHVSSVARAADNGTRDVYEVVTENGRRVRRTAHHPLYVAIRDRRKRPRGVSVRGWTHVHDVREGDLVLAPTSLPNLASRRWRDEEALLLGYLLGDGSLTHNRVGFAQVRGAVRDDFERCATALGGRIDDRGTYGLVVRSRSRSGNTWDEPVKDIVRGWGILGKNSHEKRVPNSAWTLPDDQLALVARALFDCDGSVYPSGVVAISLANELLVRDVQRLMTRLGIVGKIVRHNKYVPYLGRHYESWSWTTATHADAGRFADVVGSLKHSDKVESLRRFCATRQYDRTRRWMHDQAPTGYRWETVVRKQFVHTNRTVAIEVDEYHTYVSDVVEHNSFLASVITCHHIDTHPAREARVVTTAPSGHQVRGVLWVEINGMHERARDRGHPLPGRVNQTEWWIGSYQAAVGRKPNEYNAEQFAGFHARFPLVILDEADGIPPELWEAIEALLTNRRAKLFCIGNPINPASHFAGVRKAWEKGDDTFAGFVIPYDITPNFTDEAVSELVRDVMLSQEWVETKRRSWGNTGKAIADPTYQPLESPFWWGRVLAEYPPEDAATIISGAYAEMCTPDKAHVFSPVLDAQLVRQVGVDIAASEGGDYTVVRERVGHYALREWRIRSDDDDEISTFIVDKALEARAQRVVMDGTGVGKGFRGRIKAKLPGVNVYAVQFAGRAWVLAEDGKTKKFSNLRAQLYWETGRENMRQGKWDLSYMENYDETVTELTAARLDSALLAAKQVIQVEDKKEIKRRLGRSPDSGDALLLSFLEPPGSGIGSIHAPHGRQLPTGATVAAGRRTHDGMRGW